MKKHSELGSLSMNIFRVGVWNEDEYTIDDLNTMETNFGLLKAAKGFEGVPLVVGHDDEQAILHNDGLPAAGWLMDLTREGEYLVASFEQVPGTVRDLVQSGRYRNVSAEIALNYTNPDVPDLAGKTLRRVALLGAELPAVKGLGDIALMGHDGLETRVVAYTAKPLGSAGENKEDTITVSELERLQEQLAAKDEALKAAADRVDASEAQVVELTEKVSKTEKLVTKLAGEKVTAEVNDFVGTLVGGDDARFKDADKAILCYLLTNVPGEGVAKFSDGDGKEQAYMEVLKEFISSRPPLRFLNAEFGAAADEDTVVVKYLKGSLSEEELKEFSDDERKALKALDAAEFEMAVRHGRDYAKRTATDDKPLVKCFVEWTREYLQGGVE